MTELLFVMVLFKTYVLPPPFDNLLWGLRKYLFLVLVCIRLLFLNGHNSFKIAVVHSSILMGMMLQDLSPKKKDSFSEPPSNYRAQSHDSRVRFLCRVGSESTSKWQVWHNKFPISFFEIAFSFSMLEKYRYLSKIDILNFSKSSKIS